MRSLQQLAEEVKPFLQEDLSKTWRLFLETVVVAIGLFILTLPTFPLVVRIVASLFAGWTLVRLFIFYHDTLHGAIFRQSPVGKAVMWAYGIFILNPPNVWKRSHNYHHQHNSQIATASIGSFPIMTVNQYKEASRNQKFWYSITRHPVNFVFAYITVFLIDMCLKSLVTDPKRHWDSLLSLVVHAAIIALLIPFGWDVVVLSYILPLAVACTSGAYLFYIQHNFPGMKLRPRAEWDYVFAALNSSSYMESGRLVAWLTGNIGYHHVHHLNARIPFYRLPEVMEAIPELQSPQRTSLHPLEIYRCLRLKLWDPDTQRMVSF